MNETEFVVIGAGFAGAATAYHLAQLGRSDIVIVEQEPIPAFHSSGRNAAMIRQCVSDPDLTALARDGAHFLRHLPADWPVPVDYKQNGSLLLGAGAAWDKLRRDAQIGRDLGIDVELWTPDQAKEKVPVLRDTAFEGAAWCGTDGVIDIHALISGYLKAATLAGARIRYGSGVESLRQRGGRFEVATGRESFSARVVINAAGAWSNTVAAMAGAAELPLAPCRRHLFVSAPLDWVDPAWPFVWDVSHDIYFRPEGGGLLLCACDQREMPPCDPPLDGAVDELLAEKVDRYMPALTGVTINRRWAGLRTISGDGRFAIGWDPDIAGFFWVAGLGGHGVTTSFAVGRLAARLITSGPGSDEPIFSPARFARQKHSPS